MPAELCGLLAEDLLKINSKMRRPNPVKAVVITAPIRTSAFQSPGCCSSYSPPGASVPGIHSIVWGTCT